MRRRSGHRHSTPATFDFKYQLHIVDCRRCRDIWPRTCSNDAPFRALWAAPHQHPAPGAPMSRASAPGTRSARSTFTDGRQGQAAASAGERLRPHQLSVARGGLGRRSTISVLASLGACGSHGDTAPPALAAWPYRQSLPCRRQAGRALRQPATQCAGLLQKRHHPVQQELSGPRLPAEVSFKVSDLPNLSVTTPYAVEIAFEDFRATHLTRKAWTSTLRNRMASKYLAWRRWRCARSVDQLRQP